MSEPRPSIVILAGPNGAGKSTVAPALRNSFNLYEPLVSTWRLYDNSGPEPQLVATRLESQPITVYDEGVWSIAKSQAAL